MDNEIVLKEKIKNKNDDLYIKDEKSIYVLLSENGDIKVGVSKDVKNRQDIIGNISGRKILKYYFTDTCSNSFQIEREIHKILNDKKIKSEWFGAEYDFVIALVNDIYKKQKIYKYRSKKEDNEAICELFYKVLGINKKEHLKDILKRLQIQVEKGNIPYIPTTLNEANQMLINANIEYYNILKDISPTEILKNVRTKSELSK